MILFNKKMRYYSIIIAIIGVTTLLTYFFSPFKSYALGFLLGLIFGYVNLWTIYRKTIIVGYAASKDGHKSVISLILAGSGFVIRTAIALTAIWLAIKYPEELHLLSVILGFSLIYIIILVDIIYQYIRKR